MSTRLKYAIGLIVFTGVFAGCGTHGMIKKYTYHITKYKLQWAVNKALTLSPDVQRKPHTVERIPVTNVATGHTDTTTSYDDSYNDGDNYVTIYVKDGDKQNEYTFRYYGDSAMWNTTESSSIFICYAYDKYKHGGSEGDGGFNNDEKLKGELVNDFEKEFISKVDSLLGEEPETETR